MGVKPWESAKWVVPSLEEMSGELRKRLEDANPELVVKQEMAGNREPDENGGGGVRAHEDNDEARRSGADGAEGSEEKLKEKKDIEA
ncbi:hypothetical protein J1614_008892 [Plenodomus biglobosus]|nr:hypothetical protein J1614_008892 [Plenodomus biglobosus]